ncbi:MAG: PLD nuclease N-terminal domain-containing protein [Defluviitaleaceae bacterium]|nr:PLD nuclease N-terminal domain-containing protein [Defluviitaleaceae bacterium]
MLISGGLQTLLLILAPIVIIQLGLMIAALVHIFRHDNYKTGSRLIWVIVVLCLNLIGPILYFVIGKEDE